MYLLFLAKRYLFSRKIMSTAVIIAVTLAVFVLIVVRSVFQGFGDQMREMIKGSTAHLIVRSYNPMNLAYPEELAGAIESNPELEDAVKGTSPFVETMAMYHLHNKFGSSMNFLQVRGVNPLDEARVGEFEHYLLPKDETIHYILNPLSSIPRPKERKALSSEQITALFGSEQRDRLWNRCKARRAPEEAAALEKKLPIPLIAGIQALINGRLGYGELVQLTTYSPHTGEIKEIDCIVTGAFHTGLFEQDLRTVYIPLGAACEFAELYDENLLDVDGFPAGGYRVSGLGIALNDYDNDKKRVQKVIREEILPAFLKRTSSFEATITTWEESKKNLLQAVEVEKGIVTMIIGILVLFVGAIIFLILTLNVSEKKRDIGILKAIGARGIVFLFLFYGGVICVLGLAFGFTSGILFCHYINDIHDFIFAQTGWQLFPPDIYYMDKIPVSIKPLDLIIITGFTVLSGFLGSLLPALAAARQDPIQAIHYE